MNLKPSAVAFAAACLCGLAHNAQAQEWKFSGFGTVGAVHSSEKRADFTPALAQRDGSGFTEDWATTSDTKLGAQLDAKFSPQWSATAQVLAKYRTQGSYKPAVATAFGRYAPGGGFEIRAGRLAYASFLVSDYRDIGYSQPWVRPPLEIYNVSFSHLDGADLTWRTAVGSVGLKTQLLAGNTTEDQGQAVLTAKGVLGLNLTVDVGDFSTRASYIRLNKVSASSPGIDGAFALVRNGGGPFQPDPADADEFEIKDKRATYISWGMTYDPGTWFVTSEVGRLSRAGFEPRLTEYYVTSGVRIKAFTPYLGFARIRHQDLGTITHPIVQQFANAFSTRDQQTTTMGLRWDFANNADLKVQYDRVRNAGGATGLLQNVQAGMPTGGSYGVTSVNVDFVF